LNNYDIIIQKLDAFISKYYKNLIIRGVLYLLLISLSLFIIAAISEYFGHFSATVRTYIVYTYLLFFIAFFIRYIIIPGLALFRLSKHLNHHQASKIIGDHFPEISDKLSNILQLKQLEDISEEQKQLIEAGISQKSAKLEPIPFLKVIDFRANYKYVKYLAIPLIVLLLSWMIKPNIVTEPTTRLIKYHEEFEQEQAFSVHILNKDLTAFQKDDYELKVRISGDEIPDKLFINYQNSRYIMKKESGNHFSFIFKNLRQSTDFTISDGAGFKTKKYTLTVYPKAVFSGFELYILPPAYTKIAAFTEKNIGDIKVPEGSILQWRINTKNCDSLMVLKNKSQLTIQRKDDVFILDDTISNTSYFKIYTSNKYLQKSDSMSWEVQIIKDEYPQIHVDIVKDKEDDKLLYFNGFINDDYGFSDLKMIIDISGDLQSQSVSFNPLIKPQNFYHYINLKDLSIAKGEDISYYFVIYDNDRWNGYKSAKTKKEYFHFDSQKELIDKRNTESDSIKNEMMQSLDELRDLNKKIKDFKKELVNKELLSWDDKKKMEQLLKDQQEIQKKLEKFNKQNQDINEQSKDINQNQRILEKQEELQELFEQVMDEDTKKKMEEIRKMLEEINKENSQEMLEEMEMNAQELEDQLDRNLELYKQLEFELRLEESIEELNKLAEKQKELAEETKNSPKNQSDSLQQKQDSITKAFEDIKKELEKLDSLNKSLEEPNKFDNKQQEQKKVDSLQEKSQENLEKNKMEKASDAQEKAAEEMENMASEIQFEMEQNAMEEVEEDMEVLREILDQLLKLSFLQEDIMDTLSVLEDIDPTYNRIVRQQFQMEHKLIGVKDSLQALAKRQAAVQPFILKELNKLDYRLQSTTDYLEAHQQGEALKEQQFVMTSLNQLALMLDEAMKQMQQQMKSMMKGGSGKGKSCPKPGSGKPSPKSMKSLQQQLNNQMKALQKQQKQGKKAGKKGKAGQKGQGMSEQFARMAAEQARIRRMMEEYQQQMMEENGMKDGGLDATLKEMEKTEHDLVNKIISQETLKRQQRILTRLLKSEKAEMEREKDKKRKSREGKNVKRRNPLEFNEYKKTKEKELNMIKTLPLDFNNYYKKKVDSYFYQLENTKQDVEDKRNID